jgi:hypothetical protein
MGFTREQVMSVGSIKLQVTAWEPPREKTIMVKFPVVDSPSAYNAIFGRTMLNELKAMM